MKRVYLFLRAGLTQIMKGVQFIRKIQAQNFSFIHQGKCTLAEVDSKKQIRIHPGHRAANLIRGGTVDPLLFMPPVESRLKNHKRENLYFILFHILIRFTYVLFHK